MFDKDIREFDNQMLHCEVAFEQACFEQSLNLRKIQNKIILENADTESTDLINLYMAEAKESGEKKKNIFLRLIDTIKKFIMKIINKLTGGKFEAKEDKKVPGNPKELMKKGRELLTKAMAVLKSPKAVSAKKIAAAGIATGATSVFVIKKASAAPTLKEIRAFMQESNEKLATARNILDDPSCIEEERLLARQYISEFGKITSRLGKISSAIMKGTELSSDSKLEKENHAEGKDYAGMSVSQLKEKLENLKFLKSEEERIIGFKAKAKQAIASSKDKTPYTGAYTAKRRELAKQRIAEYDAQIKHVNELIANAGSTDAINDEKFQHIEM